MIRPALVIGHCAGCWRPIEVYRAYGIWYGESFPGVIYHLTCAPLDATLRYEAVRVEWPTVSELETWEAEFRELFASESPACCVCGTVEPDFDDTICRACYDELAAIQAGSPI